MARLQNELSWSSSRRKLFQECERRYWFNHYGAWGGWDANADPRARRLYMLKNLSNRWQWAGTVVHDEIERTLKALQAGRTVEPSAVIERAVHRMREEWRDSRDGLYRRRPKKVLGLVEHEYDEDVDEDEWSRIRDRVKVALTNFFEGPFWNEARGLKPEQFLECEKLTNVPWSVPVEVDGRTANMTVPVWLAIDFAYRRKDGDTAIVDWKTGEPDPADVRIQLQVYARYMRDAYGIDERDMTLYGVNLTAPEIHEFHVGPDDADAIDDILRESVQGMVSRLRDPLANMAVEDDFPMVDDPVICGQCVFRAVCPAESAGGPETEDAADEPPSAERTLFD